MLSKHWNEQQEGPNPQNAHSAQLASPSTSPKISHASLTSTTWMGRYARDEDTHGPSLTLLTAECPILQSANIYLGYATADMDVKETGSLSGASRRALRVAQQRDQRTHRPTDVRSAPSAPYQNGPTRQDIILSCVWAIPSFLVTSTSQNT